MFRGSIADCVFLRASPYSLEGAGTKTRRGLSKGINLYMCVGLYICIYVYGQSAREREAREGGYKVSY